MAKAAGIRIDFMESPFYRAEWRSGREFQNQWKMRKATIRIGMGTPRSPKSPYFIRFTPVTILFGYLYRLEIGSK
jgi:hypothetical protein